MKRVCLIPGGARGIGRAVGLALAEDGWDVAVCYRTSEADANSLVGLLEERGARALAVRADVSDPAACAELVKRTRAELGRIDALVQCAGPYHRVPLLEESVEGWHAMFAGNLHPVFYLAREVAPLMREAGWGRIVTFAMANADRIAAHPDVTAHAIAKSAVLILTRSLAKVLAPDGITVNAVSPGYLDTDSPDADDLEEAAGRIPAGHVGTPDDAVGAVRYLLSDAASYVSGTNVHVSGAWGL